MTAPVDDEPTPRAEFLAAVLEAAPGADVPAIEKALDAYRNLLIAILANGLVAAGPITGGTLLTSRCYSSIEKVLGSITDV